MIDCFKENINKRPLLMLFISLVVGITILNGSKNAAVFVVGLIILSLIITIIIGFKKKYIFILIPIGIMLSVFTVGVHAEKDIDIKTITAIKGIVKQEDIQLNGTQRLEVVSENIFRKENSENIKEKFIVYTPYGQYVKRNDVIIAYGSCSKGYKNLNFYANRLFYCQSTNGGIFEPVYKFRDMICKSADNIYPKNEADIIKTIITGKTSFINEDTKSVFKAAGISHILSVSGLHTALIAGAMLVFLMLIGIEYRKRYIITMIFMLLFIVFTGFRVSCVRAVIMLEILMLGKVIYKKNDTINSLAAAGTIILLFSPNELFGAGFQLSFMSVFALAVKEMFVKTELYGIRRYIFESFVATFFIMVFTFPIMSYHFYTISPYSFISNFFILPAVPLIIGFGAVSCIVGIFSNTIGIFIGGTAYAGTLYMEYVCTIISNLYGSIINTGRFDITFYILYYVAVFVALFVKDIGKQIIALITVILLIFMALFSNRLFFKENEVSNIGKNTALYIFTYDRKAVVVGGRSKGTISSFKKDIDEKLMQSGKKNIDVFFMTDDNDYELLCKLMDDIKINTLVLPESFEHYDIISLKASECGTEIVSEKSGTYSDINDSLKITCLYPTLKEPEKAQSAVIEVKNGENIFNIKPNTDEKEEMLFEMLEIR